MRTMSTRKLFDRMIEGKRQTRRDDPMDVDALRKGRKRERQKWPYWLRIGQHGSEPHEQRQVVELRHVLWP